MPYKSAKQKRLMQAVAHNAAFAEKVGIPQSVGRKFEEHKAKGGKVRGLAELLAAIGKTEKDLVTEDGKVYIKGAYETKVPVTAFDKIDPSMWKSKALQWVEGSGAYGPADMDWYKPPKKKIKLYDDNVYHGMSPFELGDSWPLVKNSLIDTDPPEAIKAMREMHGPTSNLLADWEEEQALLDYIGSGYRRMNQALREGGGSKETIKAINKLDELLARSKLLAPLKLFRGASLNEGKLIGHEDPGFGSWTTNVHTARAFADMDPRNVLMMETPTGIRGLPLVGDSIGGEHEVILPRSHVYDLAGDPIEEGSFTYFPVELRNKYAKGGKAKSTLDAIKFLKATFRGKPREIPVLHSPASEADLQRFIMLMKEYAPGTNVVRTWHMPEKDIAWPATLGMHEEVVRALGVDRPDIDAEGMGLTLDELRESIAKRLGRFSGHDSNLTDQEVADTLEGVYPEYPYRLAKGGKVDEKKRKNNLARLSAIAAAAHAPGDKPQRNKQLFLHGALSQLYGLNDRDEPAFLGGMTFRKGPLGSYDLVPTFTGTPGIVDELLSMGAILPEGYVPEVSKRAEDRLERLNKMLYEDMGLEPPQNLEENLYSAAGTMASQLPTGGGKALETAAAKSGLLGKLKRGGELLSEWFTPTTDISPASYGAGTAVGALSQQAETEAEKEQERMAANAARFAEGGAAELASMKRKYAGTGTTGALRAIKEAIAAIDNDDHSTAVELLKPHRATNPEVAEVLKVLEGPATKEN